MGRITSNRVRHLTLADLGVSTVQQPCDWQPSKDGTFRRWDLPASAWSGADHVDDGIKICHDTSTGEWWGCTEVDQCSHRDLSRDEIAAIVAECNLTA